MQFNINRLSHLAGLITESQHGPDETHSNAIDTGALDEMRLRRFIRQELQALLAETGNHNLSRALASGQVPRFGQQKLSPAVRGPGRTIGFFGPGF